MLIARGDLVRVKARIYNVPMEAYGIVLYTAPGLSTCLVFVAGKRVALFNHELEVLVQHVGSQGRLL